MPTLAHRLAALLARRESRPARIERGIDHLHAHAHRLENHLMSADRDLLTAAASALEAIGPAVDNLISDRDQWRTRALSAEGREATDEADDAAAAQPIKDALDALRTKLSPAGTSEPTPPIEDVPAVVEDAPAPSEGDGSI